MFTVTILLNDAGSYPTFQEAFAAFFEGIKINLENQAISRIALETACFITFSCVVYGNSRRFTMDFPQVAAFACKAGLIKDEKITAPIPEIASDVIYAAFLSAHAKNVAIMAGLDEAFPEYQCRPNEEAW